MNRIGHKFFSLIDFGMSSNDASRFRMPYDNQIFNSYTLDIIDLHDLEPESVSVHTLNKYIGYSGFKKGVLSIEDFLNLEIDEDDDVDYSEDAIVSRYEWIFYGNKNSLSNFVPDGTILGSGCFAQLIFYHVKDLPLLSRIEIKTGDTYNTFYFKYSNSGASMYVGNKKILHFNKVPEVLELYYCKKVTFNSEDAYELCFKIVMDNCMYRLDFIGTSKCIVSNFEGKDLNEVFSMLKPSPHLHESLPSFDFKTLAKYKLLYQ